MTRVIISPPTLPSEALAELKQWLAITTSQDDAALAELLAVAVNVCADFTGLLPLACTAEETIGLPRYAPVPVNPADTMGIACPPPWRPWRSLRDWQKLASRPVRQLVSVSALAEDGTRTVLDTAAYHTRLDADGGCAIRILAPGNAERFVVEVSAGLAADWNSLPMGLRHGIMRLAAHQYRNREAPGAGPLPPASVSALWLPWRQVRLA